MEHFKVTFAEKNHHPLGAPMTDQLRASVIHDNVHCRSSSSIVLGENGKRRFDQPYSDYERFVPSMKIVDRSNRTTEPREVGKRSLRPSASTEHIVPEKRHSSEALRKSNSSMLPVIHWTTKRTVKMDNGEPASRYESSLISLEHTMNQKQRIQNELHSRNYIPVATSGDKAYRAADREPGFYAKGGLVCGSTIAIKKSGKPTLRKSEDVLGTATAGNGGKKLEATYSAMVARRDLEYDITQVNSLTVRSTFQNYKLCDDEERVGYYVFVLLVRCLCM